MGNIGKNIALEAIECGLHVELLSPSLQKPGTRWQTLYKRGINPERVVCAESIAQALKDATYVAISVPWENNDSGTNAGMIEAKHIESLASSAQIVSASVPRIFSEQALALMNDRVQQGQIYVRIDTSKRRADEIKQSYPHIDAAHDQAFATPECQQQLDHAMLLKAREFLHSSFLKTA